MPRAVDRHQPTADYDPNRSGTEFHLLLNQRMAQMWEEIIGQAIGNATEGLLNLIHDLTGLDFSSWENLLVSLNDGKGIDVGWLITIVGKIFSAFDGINLDGAPGALINFIQSTVSNVIGDIVEVFTGQEDGDLNDLGTWINTHIREPLEAAAAAFAGLLSKLFLVDDLLEVLSGEEDGDVNDVGTFINNISSGVQNTIDAIVKGLFGWIGSGWGHEDAEQALKDEAATVAALSAAVTALQNDQNNEAVGGKTAFVDFTLRPNQTGMGSDFDLAYTGVNGLGFLSIIDGNVTWNNNNSHDPRTALFRYNLLETVTDYQKVGIAYSGSPEYDNNNPAKNYIHARKNAAGTTYVYADLRKRFLELGCIVAGAKTVFASREISFKANGIYWLEAGTIGGLRIFRVLEGNTPILTHTEVGTTSQVGPGYRYAGGGVYAYSWNFFGEHTYRPADMLAFAMGDNQPPTVLGSGATMIRTSSSNVDGSSGRNQFPGTYFNNKEVGTADIGVDLTTGRFTVSLAGWYAIEFRTRINTGASPPNNTELVLFKNGSAFKHMGDSLTNDSVDARGIGGSALVYLDVNDYVHFGYELSASSSNYFTGESTGAETYATIALTNRSLA